MWPGFASCYLGLFSSLLAIDSIHSTLCIEGARKDKQTLPHWKIISHLLPEPPTNTDSSVFSRILKLITDEKLKNTDDRRAQYAENLLNIKKDGVVRLFYGNT